MKVATDSCLFGAWTASSSKKEKTIAASVLDIGAGTGLLSLMYAQQNQGACIDAIETDRETFQQASENIAASPWQDRINIFHGDAREFEFPSQYDVIISNPPFYETEWKAGTKKENLARHNEGLLLHQLAAVIKKTLKQTGLFYLLLPFKRNEEIKDLFIANEFAVEEMVFVRQSVNHGYFRIMLTGRLASSIPAETRMDEIAICNERQEYSPEFTELLKEYYLYL